MCVLLLLSSWKWIWFAIPAKNKQILGVFFFVLGFFVVLIMGREQDRAVNPLLFASDKPSYQGNCLWDHSLMQGMNPWSEMQLLLSCPVCSHVRCWPGALRSTIPDPSPRGKREFLPCWHADGISQGYLRKAYLCDWAPCQNSLKTLFKLVKWNKILRSYWMRRLSWHCVSAWAHALLGLSPSCTCMSPTQLEGSGFWGASRHVTGETQVSAAP